MAGGHVGYYGSRDMAASCGKKDAEAWIGHEMFGRLESSVVLLMLHVGRMTGKEESTMLKTAHDARDYCTSAAV
jgi:hypothetical protein